MFYNMQKLKEPNYSGVFTLMINRWSQNTENSFLKLDNTDTQIINILKSNGYMMN